MAYMWESCLVNLESDCEYSAVTSTKQLIGTIIILIFFFNIRDVYTFFSLIAVGRILVLVTVSQWSHSRFTAV